MTGLGNLRTPLLRAEECPFSLRSLNVRRLTKWPRRRLTPPPHPILTGRQGTAGSTLTEKQLAIPFDGTARLGQGAPDSYYASVGSAGHDYPRGRSAIIRRRPRTSRTGSPSVPGAPRVPAGGHARARRASREHHASLPGDSLVEPPGREQGANGSSERQPTRCSLPSHVADPSSP